MTALTLERPAAPSVVVTAWSVPVPPRRRARAVIGAPRNCERCGATRSFRATRFCSRACALDAKRIRPRPCEQCSGVFIPSHPAGRFCSAPCLTASGTRIRKSAPTRTAVLAALAGGEWRTAADLALAVYGYADAAELHAIGVALTRARQAGHTIETRLSHARHGPGAYRLVSGEGVLP